MDISYVALHRMTQTYMKKEKLLRKFMDKNGPEIFLSSGRNMSNGELIEKLKSFGVAVDKETFGAWLKRFLSAEEISRWVFNETNTDLRNSDSDWVWICLAVLWERWFPEKPSLEMIDDMMQDGYEKMEKKDLTRACEVWLAVWRLLLSIAEEKRVTTIAELDSIFRGTQSVFNWVQDLEMELGNAGIRESAFHGERISFCQEFLKRFTREDPLITQNMKRALAGSYFASGDKSKADSLFLEWLKEDPAWGWGWIGWSDCHRSGSENNKNYERAETILKEGLAVPGVRDKEFIAERLEYLYADMGRHEELEALRRNTVRPTEQKKGEGSFIGKRSPEKKTRIGRNEPCPCGSGKKYKKCCGG